MMYSHILTWIENNKTTGIQTKKSRKTNSAFFQENVKELRKNPNVSSIRCEKL